LKAGKKTLGNCQDGAVRLFEPGPQLGLAEGIEDAIAVYQLYRIPCWACIGASRMANVWIPEEVKELIVFADRDEAGRKAAQKTAEAQRGKRAVSVMFPTAGRKDFVEMLA